MQKNGRSLAGQIILMTIMAMALSVMITVSALVVFYSDDMHQPLSTEEQWRFAIMFSLCRADACGSGRELAEFDTDDGS